MYMHLALMLYVSSMFFEGSLAYRFTRFRHFMESNEWASIIFSVALSVALGAAFGAEGLVTLIAGVASTATSPFMYKGMAKYFANEETIRCEIAKVYQTMVDTVTIIYRLLRGLTWPLRKIRQAQEFINRRKVDAT